MEMFNKTLENALLDYELQLIIVEASEYIDTIDESAEGLRKDINWYETTVTMENELVNKIHQKMRDLTGSNSVKRNIRALFKRILDRSSIPLEYLTITNIDKKDVLTGFEIAVGVRPPHDTEKMKAKIKKALTQYPDIKIAKPIKTTAAASA